MCSKMSGWKQWSHESAAFFPTRCGRSVRIAGICRFRRRGSPGGAAASAAYTVQVTEQNFQEILEGSRSAPVLLAFESPSRSPESVQLADDLQTLSNEFEGRFLLGRVDIDAVPQIAQAMQIPSVPAGGAGGPGPADAAPPGRRRPLEELRQAITQVLQQLTASGFTGRHQPRAGGGEVDEETGEEQLDPRYAPAQDALERGDIDAAVVEYEKLVDRQPGRRGGRCRSRHGASCSSAPRAWTSTRPAAAAAASPDDVEAQTLVADLDLLGGHVEDAFNRLIDLVRRTTEADRDTARTHLIGLFGAVGNEDPRVQRARRDLASALF